MLKYVFNLDIQSDILMGGIARWTSYVISRNESYTLTAAKQCRPRLKELMDHVPFDDTDTLVTFLTTQADLLSKDRANPNGVYFLADALSAVADKADNGLYGELLRKFREKMSRFCATAPLSFAEYPASLYRPENVLTALIRGAHYNTDVHMIAADRLRNVPRAPVKSRAPESLIHG